MSLGDQILATSHWGLFHIISYYFIIQDRGIFEKQNKQNSFSWNLSIGILSTAQMVLAKIGMNHSGLLGNIPLDVTGSVALRKTRISPARCHCKHIARKPLISSWGDAPTIFSYSTSNSFKFQYHIAGHVQIISLVFLEKLGENHGKSHRLRLRLIG